MGRGRHVAEGDIEVRDCSWMPVPQYSDLVRAQHLVQGLEADTRWSHRQGGLTE